MDFLGVRGVVAVLGVRGVVVALGDRGLHAVGAVPRVPPQHPSGRGRAAPAAEEEVPVAAAAVAAEEAAGDAAGRGAGSRGGGGRRRGPEPGAALPDVPRGDATAPPKNAAGVLNS